MWNLGQQQQTFAFNRKCEILANNKNICLWQKIWNLSTKDCVHEGAGHAMSSVITVKLSVQPKYYQKAVVYW